MRGMSQHDMEGAKCPLICIVCGFHVSKFSLGGSTFCDDTVGCKLCTKVKESVKGTFKEFDE